MRLFSPETYVDSIFEITPLWMKERGLEALLVDIDDTLAPHGQLEPPPGIAEWVEVLLREGIKIKAFSNNHEERVAPFAKSIGIPCVFEAGKPFPRLYHRSVREFGLPRNKVAMVGDQIFTDILGANLAGIRSVLLLTEHESEYDFTRFKRGFERHLVNGLKRRGKV